MLFLLDLASDLRSLHSDPCSQIEFAAHPIPVKGREPFGSPTCCPPQATVVIPPKRNRKDQPPYDANLYKERNIIQRFFNKLRPSTPAAIQAPAQRPKPK
jgi:hypothetical protein